MPYTPPVYEYQVTIEVGAYATGGDLPALLDMLRYEQATVRSWTEKHDKDAGRTRFTVVIRSVRPTVERWASFGIATYFPNSEEPFTVYTMREVAR